MARWIFDRQSFTNSAVPDSKSRFSYIVFDDSAKIKKKDEWLTSLQVRFETKTLKDLIDFFELVPQQVKQKLNFPKNYKTDPWNTRIYFCYCDLNNPVRGKFFLALINKLEPISDELKKKISLFSGLDLSNLDELSKHMVDINSAEQVLIKLKAEKFQQKHLDSVAIDKQLHAQASKSTDPAAFFTLGQYYQHFENDLQKALDCYQEIPEDNPNYKIANLKAAEIMMQVRLAMCPFDFPKEKLTKDQLDDLNEKEDLHLNFLLDAKNPDFQKSVDQLFAETSGEKGLNPSITGVKTNGETVVKLGKTIKNERVQKELLAKENQQLKLEIARLKQQINLNESTIKSLKSKQHLNENESTPAYQPSFFKQAVPETTVDKTLTPVFDPRINENKTVPH